MLCLDIADIFSRKKFKNVMVPVNFSFYKLERLIAARLVTKHHCVKISIN